MKKIYVTDVWNIEKNGHSNLEFIDVALNTDNLFFIDPCLIEKCNNEWTQKAVMTMTSFFDCFYNAYRNNDTLLSHAREQNATRLGYGSGDNGKGNTPVGLINDFKPLERLIKNISTIGAPQDIIVLIPGFAEDGFSDLLTNVLHAELNEFTLMQMNKHGIQPNDTTSFYTWNAQLENWVKVESPCYRYGKDELLLVPKQIVRKKYLFGVGQYFGRIILERKQAEDEWRDDKGKPIPKRVIEEQLSSEIEHWKYDYAVNYSLEHNDALGEYHRRLPFFYSKHGAPLDDELDKMLYD